MAGTLSPNEEAQLQQTIEMFEVITQSQPNDYQSLEILKEAYYKLGRHTDVVSTAKRIAQAYFQQGQLSSAILEYESILQLFPGDPDVQAALAEIESHASNLNGRPGPIEPELAVRPMPVTSSLRMPGGTPAAMDVDDGRQVMQKIFVDGKVISVSDFDAHWPAINPFSPPTQAVDPFVHVLAEKGLVPVAQSLKLIYEKSRMSYIPLERYDVDIEVARSFSKDACRRWCVLPFDRISKTVLVATANPFNKQAIVDLEKGAKARLLWYLTSPADLIKSLKKVFR
jgi:tetratricopeptide (TPR) repeat protein